MLEPVTRLRLTALDRQSLVLLGDPTVTLARRPESAVDPQAPTVPSKLVSQ
jgi:hypothetical protein